MVHTSYSGLAIVVLAASLSAQQVWRVAAAGGGQFSDVAAAVAAASDGDVILVEPGSYGPFVVDGKSLVIAGHELNGSGITISQPTFGGIGSPPPVTIKNLAANQQVHLCGMQLLNFGVPEADLLIEDCAGMVWAENLFCDSFGAMALRVERCAGVVLTDCFLQTNSGTVSASGVPVPAPGARIEASQVHAYGTQFRGSLGTLLPTGAGFVGGPSDGGSGLEVEDSRVELQRCEVAGASGHSFLSAGCMLGSNGGDGIVTSTAGGQLPVVSLRDVQVAAGTAGFASCGPVPSNGIAVRVLAGQVQQLPGTARLLHGRNVSVGPTTLHLDVRGVVGDSAFLFAASPAPAQPVLGFTLHLNVPLLPLGFVGIGVGGQVDFPLALPALPLGLPVFTTALQMAVLDGNGGLSASGPLTLLVR